MRECVFLFVQSLFVVYSIPDEATQRINEKLSTDPGFYQHFADLIAIQEQQASEYVEDTQQLEQLLDDLGQCGSANSRPDRVDTVRPEDVGIYADFGHLSTFCYHNQSRLREGDLDPCSHLASSLSLPTLDKFLRFFNPNLTVVETNRSDPGTLTGEAVKIAEMIRNIPGQENMYKLILILPSIQDGEASETGQAAVEVLTSIQEIQKVLPTKTIIMVTRSSGKGIWKDAAHSHSACRSMLSRLQDKSQFNSDTIWDQVDLIVEKNFRKPDFTVEILPLLNDSALSNLPTGSDLSSLGYDCAHWSARGLSLFHESLWNAIFTRANARTREYRPVHVPLVCPDPRCPFVRTTQNSAGTCLWVSLDDTEGLLGPQLIALSVLILAAFLTFVLILFLCLRKPKDDLKKQPFGWNFSSIRFIDEEAVTNNNP